LGCFIAEGKEEVKVKVAKDGYLWLDFCLQAGLQLKKTRNAAT
jgi:hypothetical protein